MVAGAALASGLYAGCAANTATDCHRDRRASRYDNSGAADTDTSSG